MKFPRDTNLIKYRKRKTSEVYINNVKWISKGDLLYVDEGRNRGRIYRCNGHNNESYPLFTRVKPNWKYVVATIDYTTMTLYWFDEGRYRNPSPFEIKDC